MTDRIRRLGYRITFAQYAFCHTEVPTKWKALLKRRRRCKGDVPVRHFARKHVGMATLWHRDFHLSNIFMSLDGMTFNLLCIHTFAQSPGVSNLNLRCSNGVRPDTSKPKNLAGVPLASSSMDTGEV